MPFTPQQELDALHTLPQSFQEKVQVDDNGCWVWTGGKQSKGYGCYHHASRIELAHRWAYEQLIGPIAGTLTLDHIRCDSKCANPFCCTPATRGENAARFQHARTHCKRGHEFTPENTFLKSGHRRCRICVKAHAKASYEHRKISNRILNSIQEKRL